MKSGAHLTEMMISILTVAFAGVTALGIFLSARYTQMMSFDKTNAMFKAQNAIESDKNEDFTQYFDENWQECDENTALFRLDVTGDTKEGFYCATASCRRLSAYPFIKSGSENLCEIEFGRPMR